MAERGTDAGGPAPAPVMPYARSTDLAGVRAFVRSRAETLGLPPERTDLLVLAVSELATNTLQHTAGGGRVRVWADADDVLCEVVDHGAARVFGRVMPAAGEIRGRGLAIVERVCDEVSSTVGPTGTVVLLRLRR
ncbi:ATP-binding protein [Plantactinospora sp. KBS50]|uniref:ATP-binding protein n=1 Tax=Plantactinospora sp. KBS50 TaxID=2024580 RepID=UPI000BAAB40A|nr:ATP-binding protein [Plantactinospora sp. KBS50]ASW55232.1 anti-sigma regulatory factor [Plantactinospora sp. KBS50]